MWSNFLTIFGNKYEIFYNYGLCIAQFPLYAVNDYNLSWRNVKMIGIYNI